MRTVEEARTETVLTLVVAQVEDPGIVILSAD